MLSDLNIPRCPRCWRQHQRWRTLAGCLWPQNEWIAGSGRYGSFAWCPRGLTIVLHGTYAAALASKQLVDATRCGGQCVGRHSVVDLGAEVDARLEAAL